MIDVPWFKKMKSIFSKNEKGFDAVEKETKKQISGEFPAHVPEGLFNIGNSGPTSDSSISSVFVATEQENEKLHNEIDAEKTAKKAKAEKEQQAESNSACRAAESAGLSEVRAGESGESEAIAKSKGNEVYSFSDALSDFKSSSYSSDKSREGESLEKDSGSQAAIHAPEPDLLWGSPAHSTQSIGLSEPSPQQIYDFELTR